MADIAILRDARVDHYTGRRRQAESRGWRSEWRSCRADC
jgi:hypothetical protein